MNKISANEIDFVFGGEGNCSCLLSKYLSKGGFGGYSSPIVTNYNFPTVEMCIKKCCWETQPYSKQSYVWENKHYDCV